MPYFWPTFFVVQPPSASTISEGHSTVRSLSLRLCLDECTTHPSGTLGLSHLFIDALAELELSCLAQEVTWSIKIIKRNSNLDPFKEKLYEELEANSYKLLGVPGNRVREVLSDKGEDIDAEFEAAWDFGGAAFMR